MYISFQLLVCSNFLRKMQCEFFRGWGANLTKAAGGALDTGLFRTRWEKEIQHEKYPPPPTTTPPTPHPPPRAKTMAESGCGGGDNGALRRSRAGAGEAGGDKTDRKKERKVAKNARGVKSLILEMPSSSTASKLPSIYRLVAWAAPTC